jgi:hypothetical protein
VRKLGKSVTRSCRPAKDYPPQAVVRAIDFLHDMPSLERVPRRVSSGAYDEPASLSRVDAGCNGNMTLRNSQPSTADSVHVYASRAFEAYGKKIDAESQGTFSSDAVECVDREQTVLLSAWNRCMSTT